MLFKKWGSDHHVQRGQSGKVHLQGIEMTGIKSPAGFITRIAFVTHPGVSEH
jgi:hypothetical protein